MKLLKIVIPVIILLVLAAFGPWGCTSGPHEAHRYEFSRLRMGTRANVTFYCRDEASATEAADAVFDRIARIEDVLSDWRIDSEVARLREAAPGAPVAISMDLDEVLARSREISRASQGAFDVSCGALTRLWREARDRGQRPTSSAVERARASCGWSDLRQGRDSDGPFLLMERVGVELDFGGIGKGYAADEGLEILRARGINRALVDLGGDMAVGAPPPEAHGWRVSTPALAEPLVVRDRGIATSGATEQYLQAGDQRLSHLLDPRTGEAVPDRGQFTVMAPTAAQADAWASVAAVLGVEPARQLVPAGSGIRFLATPEAATANR